MESSSLTLLKVNVPVTRQWDYRHVSKHLSNFITFKIPHRIFHRMPSDSGKTDILDLLITFGGKNCLVYEHWVTFAHTSCKLFRNSSFIDIRVGIRER